MTYNRQNRDEVLRVRVRADEMTRLKEIAQANDTSVSEYVRRSLRHEKRITIEELK